MHFLPYKHVNKGSLTCGDKKYIDLIMRRHLNLDLLQKEHWLMIMINYIPVANDRTKRECGTKR